MKPGVKSFSIRFDDPTTLDKLHAIAEHESKQRRHHVSVTRLLLEAAEQLIKDAKKKRAIL